MGGHDKPLCRYCGKKIDEIRPPVAEANAHSACYWRDFKKAYQKINKLNARDQLEGK